MPLPSSPREPKWEANGPTGSWSAACGLEAACGTVRCLWPGRLPVGLSDACGLEAACGTVGCLWTRRMPVGQSDACFIILCKCDARVSGPARGHGPARQGVRAVGGGRRAAGAGRRAPGGSRKVRGHCRPTHPHTRKTAIPRCGRNTAGRFCILFLVDFF